MQLKLQAFFDVCSQLLHRDAHLIHRISVSDGDSAILSRIVIDGNAERRTDFILAAIPFADASGKIVIRHKIFGKLRVQLFCCLRLLFGQR